MLIRLTLAFFILLPWRSLALGETVALDGVWFPCEFAHSKIPPPDGCRMLDDDGYMIRDGWIDHIKVQDSRERECRHQRLGQCFERQSKEIAVERTHIGRLDPSPDGFAISYFGCTQSYGITERAGFFEVAPDDDHCFWTSDKHYFVSRFPGQLRILAD